MKFKVYVTQWEQLDKEGLSKHEAEDWVKHLREKDTLEIGINWQKSSNAELVLFLGVPSTDKTWKVNRHIDLVFAFTTQVCGRACKDLYTFIQPPP